jgi:AmmeMemoRadiSam system protein B
MKGIIKVFSIFVCFISYAAHANNFIPSSRDLIAGSMDSVVKPRNDNISIASGVVPHHLVAANIIDNFFNYIASKESPSSIIILTPDHFKSAVLLLAPQKFISIDPQEKILQNLAKTQSIKFDVFSIEKEHGINALLPYIHKYLPHAKIIPIIIPAQISKQQIDSLVSAISHYADKHTIIIASVDFSHYLTPEAANFHDVKSVRVLLNFEANNFASLEVDSWQALYAARLFAKLRHQEIPIIIGQSQASKILPKAEVDSDTSYFSVVFQQQENDNVAFNRPLGKTILLVGDIMLDRGVAGLMTKKGDLYPFMQVTQLLRGIDLVCGNLEGPVVHDPLLGDKRKYTFNFSPEVVKVLAFENFNVFSLANNHSLNRNQKGQEETRKYLRSANIMSVGDAAKCSPKFAFTDQQLALTLLAFNQTDRYGSCSTNEIIKTITTMKSNYPNNFLIVSMHWGEEYQQANSFSQQQLAHEIIDAGADVVVGHHPHVVQNIEQYHDKMIFYSLGNFIFDQSFPLAVKQELAIGVELYPSKIIYRLFPLAIHWSQPRLMIGKEKQEFLAKLAAVSSVELLQDIKNGRIVLSRRGRFDN